jgi:hypothetical protein
LTKKKPNWKNLEAQSLINKIYEILEKKTKPNIQNDDNNNKKSNYKLKKDLNLLGLTCQTCRLGNETRIT